VLQKQLAILMSHDVLKCVNNSDSFCYVCGELTSEIPRISVTFEVMVVKIHELRGSKVL
jgi:hypothetical protein